jgi:N-acetylneuraminic acid mutarotase
VGLNVSKSVTMLLVLAFLTASCIIVTKPVFSSAYAAENSWVSKAPMQVARSGLGVAAVNGKIYAIGGSTRSGGGGTRQGPLPVTGGTVDTNEEYDPATDTWTFKAPMPTPRAGFAIAVFHDKVYCIGEGVNEVYDPATDTWENKTAMPTARTGLQANVANGIIYLIGGYVPDNSSFGFSPSAFNEAYDPATDSWTTKASIPNATSIYASVVLDNKIYVIGGDGAGTLNQIYDPQNDSWSQGAPLSSSTANAAAGATTGINAPKRIYIMGQYFHLPEQPYFNQVYDPESDSWTDGIAVPTKRRGFVVAVVNDLIYALGGYTETYPDGMFSFPYGPSLTPQAINEQYTPFGYGTVPPSIEFVSPGKQRYNASSVSLVFTVNKPVVWLGYSLDGAPNVTVTGRTPLTNVTLADVANGVHNVTVYANDTYGNMGASQTIDFIVEVPEVTEPFPTALVATASIASAAVACVGLLVYFKKRKH